MATEAPGRSILAPYIVQWSAEVDLPARVEVVAGGIAYLDETPEDRDSLDVLWCRSTWRPYEGQPMFDRIHPLRQRRAMRRLLCLVCGGPADVTDDGALWLLPDQRDDWPGWPNRMAVAEPPICLPCVPMAVQRCPALRTGAVAIRAGRYPITAVRGSLHTEGSIGIAIPVMDALVPLHGPVNRWVLAHNLIRELDDCTLIEVGALTK